MLELVGKYSNRTHLKERSLQRSNHNNCLQYDHQSWTQIPSAEFPCILPKIILEFSRNIENENITLFKISEFNSIRSDLALNSQDDAPLYQDSNTCAS